MTSKQLNAMIRTANKAISQLPTYAPLGEWIDRLAEILKANGFDATELNGFYCGHEGRTNQPVGHNKNVFITWYRMQSGSYEMIGYIS